MPPRLSLSLAAALVVLAGCSSPIPPPDANEPAVPLATPTVQERQPPAARLVLDLVPPEVSRVTVTDFDQVAAELGVTERSSDLDAEQRSEFWRRAEAETVLLADGLLRPVQARLERDFSIGQEDVEWEARLFDDAGREVGFVLAWSAMIDPAVVQRAVRAGVGPLRGATVLPEQSLVLSGAATEVDEPWGGEQVVDLVDGSATSTYLEIGCVDEPGADSWDELEAYTLSFGSILATARLGTGRDDLFERLAAGTDEDGFGAGFTGGAADPSTGRLGFEVVSPARAAALTLRRQLPFAACAG
ncbi:hypothetical protein I601_1286 [Nocardioides dokdonensis FR1436]|uniref:Uncharacterized protein n=1 Tax=Nocardioides dokdonensis FR1436 TaxID=1300347 RepID=A0A1A9GI19_9ACTN|nr:hypothetical protein [Nocardioides dokdonensis]ANH37726.1 hypothetical protein I601_1286 [Nocardioides dokdonensis FR1436]